MPKTSPGRQTGLARPVCPAAISATAMPLVGATNTDYAQRSVLPRLNEKQLADRWGISVRTLQAVRVKGGGVPFIRIGRAVRYRLEDVLAYEQAQLRISTSEPS
jgi:hypothetical protein